MKSRKLRRNSGRVMDKIYHPEQFPYEKVYWDDWVDYRDGQRNRKDPVTIMKIHRQARLRRMRKKMRGRS